MHYKNDRILTILSVAFTKKSMIRYENDQSIQDTHSLSYSSGSHIGLSTDYLLGISVNAEASLLEPYRIKNIFYRNVQNNYIQKDTDSYWIEYSPKEEPFPLRGQMRWAGTNGKED